MSSVERRPEVGVMLGGGGLKRFAAIALFEFLDEMEIEIATFQSDRRHHQSLEDL